MTTYCKIENGVVSNRAEFSGTMPDGWSKQAETWIANDTAQIGWAYANGVFTPPDAPPPPAPTAIDVIAERTRRLALGFDYNFGDARGVHHIGTADDDMKGWDAVTKASQAMIALGQPTMTIDIVTNTGPAIITALEWQQVLLAATQAQQPIWAASFGLQAMVPIPSDYTADAYWTGH